MYHIAICDDDIVFIRYIKRLFLENGKLGEAINFYEYLSGEELIRDMRKQEKYDLLILDIRFEGMDGNAVAKVFRKQFPDTVLVFCSGVSLPTVESFETAPYRYWLKEYTEERLKKELDIVIRKMKENQIPPFIMGKKGNLMVRLHVGNVEYIEISKRGSKLYCTVDGTEEVFTSDKKVSEFYDLLKEFGFAYAHNSYIVNLDYVAAVSTTDLELINGQRLSVSRSRAKEFKKAFAWKLAQKY